MRNITKKIMIYSMVGMMQVGLGATVIEASPLYNDNEGSQQIVQLDRGYYHDSDRHHHHHERRYRHDHGYYNDDSDVIGAGVIGFILGSALN